MATERLGGGCSAGQYRGDKGAILNNNNKKHLQPLNNMEFLLHYSSVQRSNCLVRISFGVAGWLGALQSPAWINKTFVYNYRKMNNPDNDPLSS